MAIQSPRLRRSKKRTVNLVIDDFDGGTNTLIDEARQSPQMAMESVNMMLDQDGVWTTRWGTGYYGVAVSGESYIHAIAQYLASDGTNELIAVGGTSGLVYKSTDDGASWSPIGGVGGDPFELLTEDGDTLITEDGDTLTTETGQVFDTTLGGKVYSIQIKDQLYLSNGYDSLVRYDGTELLGYTALTTPTNVALSEGAGLTSPGSYTVYYRITALNEVGETVGSAETSISVDITRDQWAATDEYIDISWDAVSGASRYQVYYGDESGYSNLLITGSITTNSYRDDGTAGVNSYREVPLDNTTSAPVFGPMELSGNRLWATGDPSNEYRTYYSGTGGNMGVFSEYYGGGYFDIEKGGRDKPQRVVHYRTGKGDSAATVLTSNPEGAGSIWQVAFSSLTVGSTAIVVPEVYKIVGSIGTNAPSSVVDAKDNIYFANKKGVFALKSKAQLFNVLSTEEQSVNIRPSYRNLYSGKYEDIVGHYFEGKVFFSCSYGGTRNDRIFYYDLERNAWVWYWSIGVEQFMEYTDSNGDTHLLGINKAENQIWEFSENYDSDLGTAFNTSYISPLLPVDRKDKTQFAKFDNALVELGRPVGTVTFEILGLQKNKSFASLASRTVTDSVSQVDFANDLYGDISYSDDPLTPETFSQPSVKKRLKVRKTINAIQYKVNSTSKAQYSILHLQAKGKLVNTNIPSNWN